MSKYFKEGYARFRRRAERQYLLGRAIRRGRRALRSISHRAKQIGPDDILCFVTLRNERVRLPYFLEYYRKLGVQHFLIIDNDSDDGAADYLAQQEDVSVWRTSESYRGSRFGTDWINYLLRCYGSGHWCLTVDPDEFFIYPHHDQRPLRALTDWLDASGDASFSGMLLDVYPEGPVECAVCAEGQNPLEVANWFDPANYVLSKNIAKGNLWIQGGPRARAFFADKPKLAPALNKIPLVKWKRGYVYASSTHMLLPRRLNVVYEQNGGERASGCLLHAKFLSSFAHKSAEELTRGQHYARSQEYKAYQQQLRGETVLWCDQSQKLTDWRQLVELGIMSKGAWA